MVEEIFFTCQEEFADWLEANNGARELWVGYYNKDTERTSVSWSEAVDVAVCYGWIDGIRNTIDGHS